MTTPDSLMVLIPAYNEAESIGPLIARVRRTLPGATVVVVNDGSTDDTAAVAREAGAMVLDLPCNLGVGGALQAGFQFAAAEGFEAVLRLDGDGQHPPEEAPKLLRAQAETGADLVIGVRFHEGSDYLGTWWRRAGIRALAAFLSTICRTRITDPTSGFWLISRPLVRCFARHYPHEYPEPEAIAFLHRQGFRMAEVPVSFEPRRHGNSTLQGWAALYYAVKVGLALCIDRLRAADPRLSRAVLTREASRQPTAAGGLS